MRLRYIGNGEWVEIDKHESVQTRGYVIQDSIDPFLSHADGQMYESKSVYRRNLKAMGMVEMGNDAKINKREIQYDRGDLKGDIAKVMQRYE